MKPRFQADADLHPEIVSGLVRRESLIDFRHAVEVLSVAARGDRILVSHDVRTMPVHFAAFLATGSDSPGVILISQSLGIGRSIEELLMVWPASDASDWRNLIVRVPL